MFGFDSFSQNAAFASAREVVFRVNELVINPVVTVLFGLALVLFLWGVVEYIINADNESGRKLGRQHIQWGLFGMFIMFAVFAIMQIIANSIGVNLPDTVG